MAIDLLKFQTDGAAGLTALPIERMFRQFLIDRPRLGLSFVIAASFVAWGAAPTGVSSIQRTGGASVAACLKGGVLRGVTNAGGYSFEYQSGFGQGPRHCAAWMVTNTPGRPDTPFNWQSLKGDWILLDAIVGQCSSVDACRIEAQGRFEELQQRPPALQSRLGWGPNKDTYRSTPDAYQPAPRADTDSDSMSSGIEGTFVIPTLSPPKNRVALEMRFTSSYSRVATEDPANQPNQPIGTAGQTSVARYIFTYTITMLRGPGPVRLVAGKEELGRGFALMWGSAISPELTRRLKERPAEIRVENPLTIQVTADGDFSLEADVPLALYFETTRILAARAPAYRPRPARTGR